ncbi:MAG TPA: hypothetical protein DCL15_20540 [Chloroflexi bacterium]|nr:hypothetical protein [Chloroflexota bacterium]HHW84929.1 hypothetical protein [Chloroflexota bacterium]
MPQLQDANAPNASPESAHTAQPQRDDPNAYEPPAIVYRAPLEVTAAFCDPSAGGKTPVDNCFTVINS